MRFGGGRTGWRSLAGRSLILGFCIASALPTALAASCETPQRVADGVYLIAAADPLATPQNGGRSGNSVILVGRSGITVIDPGPSLKAGQALRCSIRRISRQAVRALINTHPHPNQVLANGAFPGVPIYATRSTAETMRERCAKCQARLEKSIGREAMAGTRAVIPDRIVRQETVVHIGQRALRLLPLGDAHSRGDLAVLDESTATLISGDLGNSASTPELFDASTAGWIAALLRLRERNDVQRVIPGFGPPAPLSSLEQPLRYLNALQQFAEQEVAGGAMLPPARLPEVLRPFGGGEQTHLLNLQHVMREAEERWWASAPTNQPANSTQDAAFDRDTNATPVPKQNTIE